MPVQETPHETLRRRFQKNGSRLISAHAIRHLPEMVHSTKRHYNSVRQLFRKRLSEIDSPLVHLVRGKGLLNAVVINPYGNGKTAYNICLALKDNGLLAKQTHEHIIRFAPPLVITKDQVSRALKIMDRVITKAEGKYF